MWGARGKGRIQKGSSTAQPCCSCHLDWRQPAWKVARGDLEVCRYKALLRRMVLPSEIITDTHFACAGPLCEYWLTGSSSAMPTASQHVGDLSDYCSSLHMPLLESWLPSFTHCSSASRTASCFRPQETSAGISSAVTTVEWVWQFRYCEQSSKHKTEQCHVNGPYSCVLPESNT